MQKKSKAQKVRKANIRDTKSIYNLIHKFASRDLMLPRSLNTIYESIRDFYVYENRRKRVVACCALHIIWEGLAEIRSLAVEKSQQRKGIGLALINACLKEAKSMKISKVFALTFQPGFFQQQGFRVIDKTELPHKIWGECINCHLFPDCEETALIIELYADQKESILKQ